MCPANKLSFRPEHTDAFSSRSLPVDASVCAVEEPWLDRCAVPKRSDSIKPAFAPSRKDF